MPNWFRAILNFLGVRNNSSPFILPIEVDVVPDEDDIVHYAHNGILYERRLNDGYEEPIYEHSGNPLWLPDENDWSEEDTDAYYLTRHGDIPPSMLVDDEDERWVY